MAFRIPQARQGGLGPAPLQRVQIRESKSDQRADLIGTVASFAVGIGQQIVADKISENKRDAAKSEAKATNEADRARRKEEAIAADSAVLDARRSFSEGVSDSDLRVQSALDDGSAFENGTTEESADAFAQEIIKQTGEDADTLLEGIEDPEVRLAARKSIEPQVVRRAGALVSGVRSAFKNKRINAFTDNVATIAVAALEDGDLDALSAVNKSIAGNSDLSDSQKSELRDEMSGLVYQGVVGGLTNPDPLESARALTTLSSGALDGVLEPDDKIRLMSQAPKTAANLARTAEANLANFTTDAPDPFARLPKMREESAVILDAAKLFLPSVEARALTIEAGMDKIVKQQADAQVVAARRRAGIDERGAIGGARLILAAKYDFITANEQLSATSTAQEGAQLVIDFYNRWPEEHTQSAKDLLSGLKSKFGQNATEILSSNLSRMDGPSRTQMAADLGAEIDAGFRDSSSRRASSGRGDSIPSLSTVDAGSASVLQGLSKADTVRLEGELGRLFIPEDNDDLERYEVLSLEEKAFEVVEQRVIIAVTKSAKEKGIKLDPSDQRAIVNSIVDSHDTVLATLAKHAATDPFDENTTSLSIEAVMDIIVQDPLKNVGPEPMFSGALKRNSVSSKWERSLSDVQRQIVNLPELSHWEGVLKNKFDGDQPGGDNRFPMAKIVEYSVVEEWGTDNVDPVGEGPVDRPYGAKITVVSEDTEGNRVEITNPDGSPHVFEVGAASMSVTHVPGGRMVEIPPQPRRLGNLIDPNTLSSHPELGGLWNDVVTVEPVPGRDDVVMVRTSSLSPLGAAIARTWRNMTKVVDETDSKTRLQRAKEDFVGRVSVDVILGAFDIKKEKPLLGGLAGNLGSNSEGIDVSGFSTEWGMVMYPESMFEPKPSSSLLDIPRISPSEDLMPQVRAAFERQAVTGVMPASASWAVDNELASLEEAMNVRRGEVASRTKPDSTNPLSPEEFATFAAEDSMMSENLNKARARVNQAKFLDMRDRAFSGDPHIDDRWGTVDLYEQFNDMASYLNYLNTDMPTNPLSAKDVRRMIGMWEESQDAADWLILDTGFRRQFLPEGF